MPIVKRKYWFTAALLFCAACGPSLDSRLEELVTAKNIWLSVAGERAYSYTISTRNIPPYTVSVSDPGTLRDDWLESVTCEGVIDCRPAPSMRELFEFVLSLIDKNLKSGGKLIVKYDDDLGYPSFILFENRRGPHSVISIEVSNVAFVSD